MPSMDGCKLSFMRAILREEKKAIKLANLVSMDVPNYSELSVKNMYEDAMGDEELARYLPSIEMCSGKLPERDFFFGVMATIRTAYLT